MTLTIDPEIEPRPWHDALPARGASLEIGVPLTIHRQGGPYYLHRVSETELRLRMTRERPVTPVATSQRPAMPWARELWDLIHTLQWRLPPEEWPAFVESIPRRIPHGNCQCRAHFSRWYKANGWDYSSVVGCFTSGYKLHDDTSAKIGRERISFEEAWVIYAPIAEKLGVDPRQGL